MQIPGIVQLIAIISVIAFCGASTLFVHTEHSQTTKERKGDRHG